MSNNNNNNNKKKSNKKKSIAVVVDDEVVESDNDLQGIMTSQQQQQQPSTTNDSSNINSNDNNNNNNDTTSNAIVASAATATTTTAAAAVAIESTSLSSPATGSNKVSSRTTTTTTMTANELTQLLRQQMVLSSSSSSSSSHLQQQLPQRPRHAFWDTQPMSHSTTTETATTTTTTTTRIIQQEGPIIPNRDINEIRSEPYSMPNGYHWSNIDMTNPTHVQELYILLSQNYVEDDDASFRFDYSIEFLKWALQPPEYNHEFIFGVRTNSSSGGSGSGSSGTGTQQKLVAFISGIPTTIQIHTHTIKVVEINFLCVHKKLRSKRLAPVLIKEITRRVNLHGIFQAVYTAGTILPVPIANARYYHRNLNPKKLVDIGFSRIGHRMTMARMLKLYKLPNDVRNTNLRPMVEEDVISVHALLNTYLSKFKLKILFTMDEIRHWLLPRENVINTYVICNNNSNNDKNDNSNDNIVTDMISFYHLPSNILRHNETKLYAAYSFYNVATTVPYVQLMNDALILAKHTCTCDVYNMLNLMDNDEETILKELKFGMGDGTLQYYIYNWALGTNQPMIKSNELGIVLL